MTKQGQLNQKGINAQNWAAMSLFLQYVTYSDFRYIGFEGTKLEDFHLVFEDGRKIVCESKAGKIGLSEIREILNKIIKHAQITDQDEILIICKQVESGAKGIIENFKYFTEQAKKELQNKQHKYEAKHLKLLPQLRFWEIEQELNIDAVKLILARVMSYPDPFWVPEHRLQEIVNDLIIEKVYKGSQEGETLTKDDFLKILGEKKVQILEDDGFDYQKKKQISENRVKEVIKAVRAKDKKLNVNNEITKIYTNPSIHHFTLQKLLEEKSLNLPDWNNLWKATYQSAFSIELFKIFEKNIQGKENQQYAIDFTLQSIGKTTNYFREEFIKYDIIKLCSSILKTSLELDEKIFEITKKLYEHSVERFLYVKRRHDDSWEREEAAKLLYELYEKTEKTKLKEQIVAYILSNFNIVEDDGKFWHYTPPGIFNILKEFLKVDPLALIPEFTKECAKQFSQFYKQFGKKLEFNGWEHMGGGISQSGSEFAISDRHFVNQVIKPALQKLYEEDKERAWKFVSETCITRKISDVNSNNPDFLNRAAMGILFQEYKGGKHSNEVLEILSDFVRMRNGIPWKADLIFQELRGDYTDEQKWNLIKVSLSEYNNLPVNVFVEQIVSDLTKSDNQEVQNSAIQTITDWSKNPEYTKRHSIGSFDIVDNIFKLLNNPKTFDDGIEILKNHLSSKDFIEKTDTFDTYDVAKAVAKVIDLNTEKGLDLLERIYSSETLTINQQITFCSGVYNISGDKPETLLQIFQVFLKPKLELLLGGNTKNIESLKDIKGIEKRFNYRYARESLIQFAEKLAKAGYKKEALWMTKVFIHDSDPPRDGSNYPDDEKGELNEHARIAQGEKDLSIRTVRGYCAWTLQKLVVPFSQEDQKVTREIIPDCIQLVRLLCFDTNYYVRAEGCIPLIELMKNRHTHIPGDPKQRFISEKLAEEIESIAFRMLNEENIRLRQVAKHLAMVFTYMRTLGTKRAKRVIEVFLSSKDEDVIDEISPLIIYYSLFRKSAFPKWPWKKLEPFNPDECESLLEKQLTGGRPEVKARLAWQFERLPDEIKNTPEEKRTLSIADTVQLSAKYLKLLTKDYDQKVFNDIYRFIEDHIDEYFDICFDLWTKCIETESKYFRDNWSEDKLQEMYWWPFFYNGKILVAIANKKSVEAFLTWLEKLADYPNEVLIANDLDTAVEYLTTAKTHKEKVKKLFDRLIQRNPKYYEYKQRWGQNIKKASK